MSLYNLEVEKVVSRDGLVRLRVEWSDQDSPATLCDKIQVVAAEAIRMIEERNP